MNHSLQEQQRNGMALCTYRSGELARLAGVSTDTLRHYERMGVLEVPARNTSGYRHYPGNALERIRLVRSALALGFTLAELARILRVRKAGGAPCREVRALAGEKLAHLGEQIAALESLQHHMRQLIKDWDRRLAKTPPGARAALLDSLANVPSAPALPRRGK